jgi:hypothetical protein
MENMAMNDNGVVGLLVNWERLTKKSGQNMRVRMLEASELPTKEYLPRNITFRSSKIPISVGRLPERKLKAINPNGEKTVFMWDDKPAAIEPQEETTKDRTHANRYSLLANLNHHKEDQPT